MNKKMTFREPISISSSSESDETETKKTADNNKNKKKDYDDLFEESSDLNSLLEDEEEDVEFVVEEIVNHRQVGNSMEYFIHWHGYPQSENTWESIENLKHCTEKIAEYWENVHQKEEEKKNKEKSKESPKKEPIQEVEILSDSESEPEIKIPPKKENKKSTPTKKDIGSDLSDDSDFELSQEAKTKTKQEKPKQKAKQEKTKTKTKQEKNTETIEKPIKKSSRHSSQVSYVELSSDDEFPKRPAFPCIKILSCMKVGGKLTFYCRRKGRNVFMPTERMKEDYPQVLLDYYESLFEWGDSIDFPYDSFYSRK